jgi:hypothetical protein
VIIQWSKNVFNEYEKINAVVFVFRKVNTVDPHNLGLKRKNNKKTGRENTSLVHIQNKK